MIVNYKNMIQLAIDTKKLNLYDLEKKGVKMLFVTGADLYAAKNFLAQEFGEDFKSADVERGLPKVLEKFSQEGLEIGTDEKDGSIKYGVFFIIPETVMKANEWCVLSKKKLYNYEDGLKKLEEFKNKVLN